MRIHGALGETALVTRTRAASVVLTGLEAEEVDRVSQELMREDSELVETEDFGKGDSGKDGAPAKAPAAAPAKDGGK